jgi:two-component system response regulator AtoC
MANDFEVVTRRSVPRTGPSLLIINDGPARTVALPPHTDVCLGRSSDADIRLDHPSVGRRHLVLQVAANAFRVRDLGSTNGSRLRGAELGASFQPISVGDALELGDVIIVLQGPPEAATADGTATPSDAELRRRIAQSSLSVLVLGETGVGKERVARQLHEASRRARGPLITVNCAALAESLLESELFGHERGAFTGAATTRTGLIESAHGGTLVLDEVGELSPAMQAKLLRVLEQREIVRVGSVRAIAVDVRFVSATHRDLPAMIESGHFRRDLYFRLAGVTITVPALRERIHELPGLARELLAQAAADEGGAAPLLSGSALAKLAAYRWPGNVRELRNVLARALLACGAGPIEPDHLQLGGAVSSRAAEPPSAGATAAGGATPALPAVVDEFERQRILDALERCGGNQSQAAELLGISRRKLVGRLQAWGMTRPRRTRVGPGTT